MKGIDEVFEGVEEGFVCWLWSWNMWGLGLDVVGEDCSKVYVVWILLWGEKDWKDRGVWKVEGKGYCCMLWKVVWNGIEGK